MNPSSAAVARPTSVPSTPARAAPDPGPPSAQSSSMAASTSPIAERRTAGCGVGGDGAERRPANSDAALAGVAGQEAHGRCNFVAASSAPQKTGQLGDLGGPRCRGGHPFRGRHHVGEMHPRSVAHVPGRSPKRGKTDTVEATARWTAPGGGG